MKWSRNIRARNPHAHILEAASRITVPNPEALFGLRALVVEDGPTLTHGGMAFGAGTVAAQESGAMIVDPRPFAVGRVRQVFTQFPHLGSVLPAMGYSPEQIADLEQTIRDTPCDVVVEATPAHLDRLMDLPMPVVRAGYETVECGGLALEDILHDAVAEREPLFA